MKSLTILMVLLVLFISCTEESNPVSSLDGTYSPVLKTMVQIESGTAVSLKGLLVSFENNPFTLTVNNTIYDFANMDNSQTKGEVQIYVHEFFLNPCNTIQFDCLNWNGSFFQRCIFGIDAITGEGVDFGAEVWPTLGVIQKLEEHCDLTYQNNRISIKSDGGWTVIVGNADGQ